MTELNCLLPADNLRLILIGNNLYQDCYVSTRFYRLAMFPRMTMFEGNMVTARECATLTTVDPYFLLLSCLVSHRHK